MTYPVNCAEYQQKLHSDGCHLTLYNFTQCNMNETLFGSATKIYPTEHVNSDLYVVIYTIILQNAV